MEEAVPFLGNLTTCQDDDFARKEIMKLNAASTVSWWDVWISSGVLASILLSAGVANLGVSLVHLADPLMVCNGRYEGPPLNFNFQEQDVKALMREKIVGLKMSALGGVVFWGSFMNLLMLNIVLGKTNEHRGDIQDDAAIGAILLPLSLLPIAASLYTSRHLSKRAKLLQEQSLKKTDCESVLLGQEVKEGDVIGQDNEQPVVEC